MELVSVIITTYKGVKKLARAIDSVLEQTYSKIEIIVVDDNPRGSKERACTEKIMNQYKEYDNIFYIKHVENCNGAVARNTGISYARGKYIAFLDDDDYFVKRRIEESVIQIQKKKAQVFLCAVCIVRTGIDMKFINVPHSIKVKDILLNECIIGTGSNLFVEREKVIALKGFDEAFMRYQDREFMMRLLREGKVCVSDEVLVVKSKNGQSNIPNLYSMQEVEDRFLEKFYQEYNLLSPEEKRRYVINKAHKMFELAIDTLNYNEIEKYYRELECENAVNWYEKIAYLLVKKQKLELLKNKEKFTVVIARIRNVRNIGKWLRHRPIIKYVRKMEKR